PEVLAQAAEADGLLALAGPEELSAGAIDHYLRLAEPLHRLRQLRRRALPWREAVRRWAEGQADGAGAEVLLGTEAYRLGPRRLGPGGRAAAPRAPPALGAGGVPHQGGAGGRLVPRPRGGARGAAGQRRAAHRRDLHRGGGRAVPGAHPVRGRGGALRGGGGG